VKGSLLEINDRLIKQPDLLNTSVSVMLSSKVAYVMLSSKVAYVMLPSKVAVFC
jgi:hypothetical protein